MRFCEQKEVGVPHKFNMGGTYYPDIQRSLYDQGVPDRSRWVQEAGNIVLVQISKKNMSLRDQKKYQYAKLKFCLPGTFRSAETLGPALTTSKPYIPDNSKPSSPGIDCKNAPKHLHFCLLYTSPSPRDS